MLTIPLSTSNLSLQLEYAFVVCPLSFVRESNKGIWGQAPGPRGWGAPPGRVPRGRIRPPRRGQAPGRGGCGGWRRSGLGRCSGARGSCCGRLPRWETASARGAWGRTPWGRSASRRTAGGSRRPAHEGTATVALRPAGGRGAQGVRSEDLSQRRFRGVRGPRQGGKRVALGDCDFGGRFWGPKAILGVPKAIPQGD